MAAKNVESLNLENLFEYLQPIATSLQSVIRWKAREKIAGQSVKENVLQHTVKTVFVTLMLAVEENKRRAKKNQLDIGMLSTMALMHDFGEIVKDKEDTAHYVKMAHNRVEDIDEFKVFCRLAIPLPEEAQCYFIHAVMQTMPGSEEYIDTKEARFFDAVESLMYLKRGLYECSRGNLHFAPKCLDWGITSLKKHAREFPSLKNWYEPCVETAAKYLKEFEAQREKYIAKFIENGNPKEDFPF